LTIIVIRWARSTGEFVLSTPCSQCKQMFINLGINKVKHSNEFGHIISKKILDIPDRDCRLTRSIKDTPWIILCLPRT
jgi:deoxycytidylate deaminase